MKITNKNTGHIFDFNGKEVVDFFCAKNARGEYINTVEDYEIENTDTKISDLQHWVAIIALTGLFICSFLYYIHLNY